ncbi:C-X-C motif chemokine 9 [Dicentrarchus labrax]|uniref:Chemokine interleukin-8-like domain-containing protein n=1 Tax=Dicentrarchus labrax TaxID=13489 RepID=A0A8C4DE01_DICLA|nr:C-X-C motif chemokine 9 [Dicentrarchus labrax]
MALYLQSVCQLAFLSICCVLITVRESHSTFVPGRCACPSTKQGVRGHLKDLTVHPKNPNCDTVAVIVTLRNTGVKLCLNPEAPLGKQLIRCWNRAQKLGRDVNVCLRRRRKNKRGGQQRQRSKLLRSRGNTSSSNSQ